MSFDASNASTHARRHPATYPFMAALAVVPSVIKLLCYPQNIGSDDAYIHLRVATNFIAGRGWGINPGEPVNLSTSPAFTLLLSAAELVTRHGILLTQVLSALAVIAGLVLIFFTALAETSSIRAALFAEFAASFSVNLWRWNGSLMEATFAFAVISLTLYLFRGEASPGWRRVFGAGIVLGIGMLLRPEMGIVVVLALYVQWMRSKAGYKVRDAALLTLGIALMMVPWCVFAMHQFGAIIPTTFAAKSTHHLRFVNPAILRQMAESVGESLLFPTILVVLLLIVVRRKHTRESTAAGWLRYVLPAGWVLGLMGFYYLKTASLQSTGRYVLPLLPAEVMLLWLLLG